jgi:hypothetical protein
MTRASRISAAPVVERIGHASGDGDGPITLDANSKR